MIVETKMWKGNSKGTGFIRIPKDFTEFFDVNDNIKVQIKNGSLSPSFFATIRDYKGFVGVYVPKNTFSSNNLIGKKLKVSLDKIKGFHSKLGTDGRLYIPKFYAEELKLDRDDILLIEARINDSKINRFCEINKRVRKNTTEYFCMFSPELKKMSGTFKIRRKLKKDLQMPKIAKYVLKDLNYGVINDNTIIIFYHKKTLKINPLINLKDLVYYIGCFFADGTKRGSTWGIVASTFDQARFYYKMYKKMIKDPQLHFYISVSSEKMPNKSDLIKKWKKETGININKIRFHKTQTHSKKIHKYGSLVMRDYRKVVQIYHNKLLEYICDYINQNDDEKLALDFIFGVLEGDGCAGARKRGHITIASNKRDAKVLEKILRITGLDSKITKEGKGKISIRLNSLGILKDISSFKDKVFRYYPKRKKKFVKRFCNIGAVKLILGKQDYASSWVKAWLKRKGILNDKYQLTLKGKKIRNHLLNMMKEVNVK